MCMRRFILTPHDETYHVDCAYCGTLILGDIRRARVDHATNPRCPRCGSSPTAAWLLRVADHVEATVKRFMDGPFTRWFGP